jgi:hypothetical protein
MNTLKSFVIALVFAPWLGAQAATITGIETDVELTAAGLLASNGVSVQPVGTGSLDAATVTATFPITGGTLNDSAALIEHDGSGLALSKSNDHLLLLNFLIDTAAATVFGDAVVIDDVGGTPTAAALNDIPLFTLGALTTGGIPLLLSGAAAGALSSLFGLPDLTGAQIGLANPSVSAVPVPAAVWLMGSAIAAIGLRRRRV